MELELEPQAPWVSQSCREAGTCDYGIYPLSNRFYMDQVPLDLFSLEKPRLTLRARAQVSVGSQELTKNQQSDLAPFNFSYTAKTIPHH